jgi:C-terminal four TMM region of protein-O-mannosyltransferase/Dolichyl-phosphate-mannose-protein mannosyltransferase
MQGAVGAILIVLALGLALRLLLLYLLPGSGFGADLTSFRYWAGNLADQGLYGFYEREFFHDYTPGYLYVLWLVGVIGRALGGIGDLIKIPPVLADLAVGYLVWSMIRELGARERLALLGAAVVMVNPIFWFDNVVWGQVDSFGLIFLLLGLRELWRDRPERAAIFTVIAAIIKPQLGILVPIVAVVTIRRALWPPKRFTAGEVEDAHGDDRSAPRGAGLVDRFRAWERRTDSPLRIATTGLAGLLTAVALCLPFGLGVMELRSAAPFFASGLVDQIVKAGGGYPFLTVNAYNAWALVPSDLGNSLASSGQWVCDVVNADPTRCGAGATQFGAIPAVTIGAAILLVVIATVLWTIWRRPDRLTILVGLAVIALAFFAAPTRVHERYGFPFFALGAILLAISTRWRVAYVVLTIATFANMYVVLTTLYPPEDPTTNPVRDWLGIGDLIRSQLGVTVVAILHTAAAGWAWLQLRAGAQTRLEAEAERAAEPGSEATATLDRRASESAAGVATVAIPEARPPAVTMPTWSERGPVDSAGAIGWIRDRIRDAPYRADRSRLLASERGGRLDRLDLWLLVVLVLATFGMRTFRLAEPYQMQFDEVYHARTGTEFLQDWRYGISHDIYEWTHPHLAKYAMAGGLMLWGEDDVAATSELGEAVRDAAIEHRRLDEASGEQAGERVHLATANGIRTLDLRTRVTDARIPDTGVSALMVDQVGSRLVIGHEDGSISTLDLDLIGLGGPEASPEPIALTSVDAPITHLLVTDDGLTILAASSDGLVTAIDAESGQQRGSAELEAADLSNAGSGPVLQADPAAIQDIAALSSTLVELIGGETIDYESRLAGVTPGDTVILGTPGSGDTRKAVEAAIAEGRLPGVEIVDLPRAAVATKDGVAFIDPSTAAESSTTMLEGGAHGLTLVTGIDDTKLYVTTGTDDAPAYQIIQVTGDEAADGPLDLSSNPLPAPATRIAYDAATQQVHILGRRPDGNGWTVYVVEPHANAVYADAALPAGMEPVAWAMDVEPDYQSEDREQLLVFGSQGQTASIAVGSHGFAWRLPGVLASVVMAACVYLLARILFRRRSVAVAAGAFVLLDGMVFVQSRIGMNDAYVGAFILAAYTLFAAIWTGWWRGRAAFWFGMPVVGALLGLGLASKWVAAYALGALVLLLLVRSALGRVVAILGLIGLTAVLGYIAVADPPGDSAGNVPFFALMIGLTLVAVVTAVFHPIAWTDEETWLALIAPTAVGAAIFFGALAIGRLNTTVVLGPVSTTPLLAAIAAALGSVAVYAAFRLGGILGYGPMAPPVATGDPYGVLEPPAPAPEGWLRPGWLLGLPLVWAAFSLIAIPLVIYVASYIPWAAIENHRLWDGYPAGHTGQTLLDLTGAMYNYHNLLTSPHPASSPWWAWPFDLKPVWFYQDGFAGSTSAAVYDAGNLVIWWFGIVGLVFTSIMAFRRRSLALALIAIGFAAQWVPWARIDRAAFQYHYYTALPFVILALAYLVAELWHGASRRTWALARIAGALAIVAPALLWLFSRPLCGLVGVTIVNPGSQACPAVIPEFVLTIRTAALLGVVAIAALTLGRGVWNLGRPQEGTDGTLAGAGGIRTLAIGGVGVALAFVLAALLPDARILTWPRIPVEPIALLALVPLAYLAAQVLAARDARRFVAGLGVAAAAWFVVWYPNLAALPLPTTVVNAYQGVLPTYLYAFQFPVNTAVRPATSLGSPIFAALTAAIVVTCLVVGYSASTWRVALAESRARAGTGTGAGSDEPSGSDESAGLARSGGGA